MEGEMAIYASKYGTLTTGTPEYGDKSWSRVDTWTPSDGGKPMMEWCLCIDRDDDSNRIIKLSPDWEGGQLDTDCDCCFLNIAHTQRKHDTSLARKRERKRERCPGS